MIKTTKQRKPILFAFISILNVEIQNKNRIKCNGRINKYKVFLYNFYVVFVSYEIISTYFIVSSAQHFLCQINIVVGDFLFYILLNVTEKQIKY